MADIFYRFARWAVGLLRIAPQSTKRQEATRRQYRLRIFLSREQALGTAHELGKMTIYPSLEHPKWLFLLCPCGCGEVIHLNLMKSKWPCWDVSFVDEPEFSVFPSVDVEACGAHFLIRSGKVIWCD